VSYQLVNDLARRRTSRWRIAAVVHLDITSLATKIALCLTALWLTVVTTSRLVVVGRCGLLAVMRLLGVVVGVVLLLPAKGRSSITCPSSAVERLATGLATTAGTDASAHRSVFAVQLEVAETYAMRKNRISAAMTMTAKATQRPQLLQVLLQRYTLPN